MKTFENQIFSKCDIKVDGNSFIQCKFFECRFVFCGNDLFYINRCDIHECYMVVHEDVFTIVEMLRILPQHGGIELFSIISAYIQEQSSYQEYSQNIAKRFSASLLLRGKLFNTIEFIRLGRDVPAGLGTNDFIAHIHQKIDIGGVDIEREACAIRDGAKYIYLPEEWMIKTWTDGGKLPIALSSSYKADERSAQMTPDENLILDSNMPLQQARELGFDFGENVRFCGIENCMGPYGPIPDIFVGEHRREDGLVLCFANSYGTAIARRFNRKFCVRVDNLEALKSSIDMQLGVAGISGDCKYTIDHNRNHFLKYVDDAWQDEFRIFWPLVKKGVEVILPPNCASAVDISEFKDTSRDEFKRISSLYATQLVEIDQKAPLRRPVPTPFD
jgi:hypothetical protein